MDANEKIARLLEFKRAVFNWSRTAVDNPGQRMELRAYINQNILWVRREVIEAGCYKTLTVGPPPAVGGPLFEDMDVFENVFNPPYKVNLMTAVIDMVDQAIGVIRLGPPTLDPGKPTVEAHTVKAGYACIAMPMDPNDPGLVDVLEAIKEGAKRCGVQAERIDEDESNERITDRILESIRKAEFVICDLTSAKPNVFWEAGYAHGIGKTPIYVARHGTKLEFDLKDYPVIFFKNMKELKDSLEKRIHALQEKHAGKEA